MPALPFHREAAPGKRPWSLGLLSSAIRDHANFLLGPGESEGGPGLSVIPRALGIQWQVCVGTCAGALSRDDMLVACVFCQRHVLQFDLFNVFKHHRKTWVSSFSWNRRSSHSEPELLRSLWPGVVCPVQSPPLRHTPPHLLLRHFHHLFAGADLGLEGLEAYTVWGILFKKKTLLRTQSPSRGAMICLLQQNVKLMEVGTTSSNYRSVSSAY